MDPLALLSCDAAASAGTWRLKPPAAHVALGGSQAAPRSPSQCQSPSSVHSVCLPSQPANHIIYRTAVYGPVCTVVWEGRSRETPPYPDRFRSRVRELTRRTRGKSLAQIIKELSVYLIGWRGYFGFCETPSVLRELDQWTRRTLRAVVWMQWKRGTTRYAELRRCGVGRDQAAQAAGSPRGPWRLSNSPALAMALSNGSLKSLGLATVARSE